MKGEDCPRRDVNPSRKSPKISRGPFKVIHNSMLVSPNPSHRVYGEKASKLGTAAPANFGSHMEHMAHGTIAGRIFSEMELFL